MWAAVRHVTTRPCRLPADLADGPIVKKAPYLMPDIITRPQKRSPVLRPGIHLANITLSTYLNKVLIKVLILRLSANSILRCYFGDLRPACSSAASHFLLTLAGDKLFEAVSRCLIAHLMWR